MSALGKGYRTFCEAREGGCAASWPIASTSRIISPDRESVASKRDAMSLYDSDSDASGNSLLCEKCPSKRARGRMTGNYVGLSEAKRHLVQLEREIMKQQAEQQLLESGTEVCQTRSSGLLTTASI